MMVISNLDTLPEELIGLVAVHADAVTALKLSQTCRRAQSACYNIRTFQEILTRSQLNVWGNASLDFGAITVRARGDISIWARYAVADYCTAVSSREKPQWAQTPIFLPNEPELFLVNHPSLYQQKWKRITYNLGSIPEHEVYCLALSILAGKEPQRELLQSLELQERRDDVLHEVLDGNTSTSFTWAFCIAVLMVRCQLHRRLAVWPYMDAALIPHIPLPGPEIPTKALRYSSLPLPFPRTDGAVGAKTGWLPEELSEALDIHQDIVGTRWQGYYTYLWDATQTLDPPMLDVKFGKFPIETETDADELEIVTRGCRDGHGPFRIRGKIGRCEHGLVFNGRKSYASWGFDWRLKWQSSNMAVGFWGDHDGTTFHNMGLICLWKVT